MKWKWKRPAAFLLAAAMIFTMPGVPASAVEAGVSAVHTGLCEHHPEHTEDCGYTEGTEGAACKHEHTEDCYTLVKKCIHEHDESCGYIPATEGTPCGYTCEQCNSQDSGLVPGASGNAPAECICEIRCEKEAVNPDCPVCSAEDADLSACKGTEETVCICTDRCSEEMVNPDCPICSAENADFSACLGKEAAVLAVQALIDALPETVTADNATKIEEQLKAIDAKIEDLTDEQVAKLDMTRYNAVYAALAAFALPQAAHTHCVCGGNGDVNGHEHDTAGTEWTTTDSLPDSAGSYYLTQSVSGSWTVPTGEVNLCLNGQTINGKITVGSGATLTLTDCTGTGKLQGSRSGSGVSINGGTFNLYGGTITGFVNGVEIGSHNDIKTGSSFTMYGGAITGNKADSSGGGGVFLIGTTNSVVTAPSFTMHGGTISNNTAGASDGGGGGVYVGVKCSFTMDGGTITGNTATAGNGGGIYIHFNAGKVSISGGTITGNKATATGNISCGHGGGIYSERGVTVGNVKITGNNSTFEGGGIYGKGAITLTDATVTDNNQYDVYYDGKESTTPELTVSGSVKAGYYANYAWKLPILVSGALNDDSVIRVGVRDGIKPNAGGSLLIAEPASGVTLRAENFKADAADCVTSLGDDGKVYLVPCTHEMDDTGYTCSKCGTTFDARVGESAYYQTLTKAFDAARGNTVTLLRDVTLTGNCSSDTYSATLDLNGKTVSSDRYYICVGGGNKPNTLTVKDSGTGGGTQALTVKFLVYSNGTLAVDNSYTGKISRVELQAGGALERFGGEIGELVLSNAAHGSTSTGYGLKLWKGNTNACTIGGFTDNTTSKSLTVNDLLGTAYAKCELYGEKDGTWSIVDKSTKIAELTGYTAYKVQFPECVHQCADDSNPVCSVCHKKLYTKITAKAADGTTKTAYFTEDSALENGYVEAIQTLNGWSAAGCTEPTLTLLRDMYAYGTSMPLTGTLTLKGGTHTAKNVTVAEGADVTFASGSYIGATIDGTATVKEGVTFTDASVEVNGTLNAKGGTFTGNVKFNGSSIANISGGSFNNEKKYGGVTFDYNVTGTITGGTFTFADFYTTKVKLSGGTFTIIKSNGDRKLADLLAEGAAYYGASDNQAVTNDGVNTLENVKVVSHTHNGGTDGKGICSVCKKQMAASLTVGGKTSWYAAFATAIEAANAADGEKTITLYQDVNGYADGHSTTYELTHGPVTLATGGKSVTRANLTAKGISLTVTGSNGGFNVTVEGKDAELTVNDKDTKLAIVTAQNGGKLSLSNGTFSRVAVKDDGSSASLSGGSYGEITSDAGYVKPYALLAKGYAYKKTRDNQWLPNANSIPSEVTVEKAPFAVEKIYPNSDTNYTGNSAFATDGNITLTAVIASEPETENVTYYYWWELFNESENDWTTRFKKVNTATHTGEKSKTLTISGLPVDKSYQYHIFVQCSNGYQCYSEPFTVTQHQHSWTYSASGATITAKCTAEGCYLTDGNGGSVTINAPAADTLTYNGKQKAATVTSSDWKGVAIDTIAVAYAQNGKTLSSAPTGAGEYTASITVGEDNKPATASVKYTIQKADPVVTEWPKLSAPVYVNSEATLTGGSGEGTFDFKAGAAKSWDSAGSKTTTIVFTPTDTNNYKELTQDYTVTVVKRTVKNCNTLTGITDKPYGTALEELGLPETVTITTEDGKTFDKIPVTWNGYNPNTLEEQTLTGTLDLTSIANEVEQPGTPVTAQIKVKLTQKSFSGISAAAYEGVYDGSPHGITLTGVPSGATVKYGTSADSCTQDSLTYTNFTNGAKTVYYKVSQSGYADASGSATVNITKRPLTVSSITENKTYAYASGSDGKAIGVNIAGKLPTDRGTTAYAVAKTDTEKLLSEVTVDTAGNLTYKVNQVDASKVGKTAIITVTASMENYANAGYTLTISITDKKTVEIKSGNTVSVDGSNALTYGEKVSKLTLGNTVFVEAGTDDVIEGILSWSNPDEIPAAGTTQAGWVFKPADSTYYAELTGTAAITVAKATPIVVTVPTVAERGYNPDAALTGSDITGGSVTGADGNSLAGTWSFTGTNIIPTVNNKGYQAVFTPDDTNNYNTVTRTITVTVNKAAKAPNMPEAAMTPAHSTKKVGNITLQEGWSWQEADKDTVLADGVAVTATAVYIGADKGNYETESVSITITRRECDHTHTEIRNQREATCTQTGYAGDTYCTDCNKLMSTGKELAALGHDYKATVTKQPTTTEEGVRTYTCTKCGHSYTQSIAKIKSDDSSKNNGNENQNPKSDDSSKDNGSQNQKPQSGTDNGNQNQKPQPDTDNGKDNGTSIKPYIKDDSGKEGWDVIKPQLEEAKAGDTVTVVMNGTTVVPKDVIDSIKGKDTTLVLDMGNGLSWKIYGKDITDAAGDIDFDVTVGADAGKSIPVDVINNVTGERSSLNLTLAYDGEFGFTATLTVNMKSKNAGLYANLFYYNEQTGELEFISAGQIDSDGNVELVFTHASDYTIVVDTKIMSDNGQADNKADETIPAPKTDDSTSKYAWNNTIIVIIGICIILIVTGAIFYVRKKSGLEEE